MEPTNNTEGTQQVNATPAGQNGQTIIVNQTAARRGNGIGTAGFVLAIIALVIGWIPFIGQIAGGILWILGLIFSFVGVFRSPRGLAIAGLVISLIDVAILLVIGAALFA